MSQTLRADAQAVLLAAYGGKLKHDEMGFTEQQVMYWLVQERDRLMERDIDKTEESYQPDPAYFSIYGDDGDAIEIKWSTDREWCYIDLPGGDPPYCLYDRGVRIEPVIGGGMPFLRTPRNWVNMNPELAWMEGHIPWELHPGKIVFPTLGFGEIKKVVLWIIESKSVNPDKPLRIPSRHRAECRDYVLRLMGVGRQDVIQDAIDQTHAMK